MQNKQKNKRKEKKLPKILKEKNKCADFLEGFCWG